ncbi:hypothetical protein DRN69_00050 [Candidatus Pacearchaeota archaeon]|nr:MAG: hypothetical protein DRN69_00050 [Candidatus Pacearchaeota archaeon]
MKWGEYLKWLDKNRNREERHSKAIVEEVARVHDFSVDNVRIFPRRKISGLEFDLLLEYKTPVKETERNVGITYMPYKKTREEKILGIEFKEDKFITAVEQAIKRRPYVDYIYVAALAPLEVWNLTGFFQLIYYGIGLVGWTYNGKALCLIKSSCRVRHRMRYFVFEDLVAKVVEALHKSELYFDRVESKLKAQQKLDLGVNG